MFFVPALRRHPEFRAGLREMAPQAPGIAAWGLMTGVAMVKSGLSVTESALMAVLVFAGSSQLASLPLLVAGAPAWVILATGFCVNLRFVVFSLHLRPYLVHLPVWRRLTHGYLTADLSLRVVAAAVAGATATVAYALPPRLNIVLAIGVAVLLCLVLERSPPLRRSRA